VQFVLYLARYLMYLRPLYDGLNTVLGREQTARFIERGIIEIAPLAFLNELKTFSFEHELYFVLHLKSQMHRLMFDHACMVLGREQTARFIERGIIEIAPLAYMRGRTLDDAFVTII
jgi:phosphate starvation-inducible PhoH-like protein